MNLLESPAAQYVVGRRPGKSLSPELVQRLREWLSDCQDSRDGHRNCPRRVSPELPTRVVDLGTDEGSPIRLRVNPSGARGQYVALSYCWEETSLTRQRPRTSTATLSA